MLPKNAVFRSAFTSDGWQEPGSADNCRTALLSTPPSAATPEYWQKLLGSRYDLAEEYFLDPLAPNWLEGYRLPQIQFLKSDSLHPRNVPTAPFRDDIFDLFAWVAPLSPENGALGCRLLQRRASELCSARNALQIARAFLAENLRIAAALTDGSAVKEEAELLWNKVSALPILPAEALSPTEPSLSIRFFSAISANGIHFCESALQSRSDLCWLLEDDCGAVSRMLLFFLLRSAQQSGEPVCVGRCPFFWPDKIDHLLFPRRRLLISTANRYHRYPMYEQKIDCMQQLMQPLSAEKAKKVMQNRIQCDQLLKEACGNLREVWRIQAALSDLCPVFMQAAGEELRARINITAKNSAET